jgi:cephalosporin hydroxylase
MTQVNYSILMDKNKDKSISIDMENGQVTVQTEDGSSTYAMNTEEAFNAISRAWLRCGWDTKYVYSFAWMGRPVIQFPEDMIRLQEVIYSVQPDVIIETGVAHGGSLVFYASLCKAMNKGRVVGIDIEIRPHNRKAIEGHELFDYITLIEGSSIEPQIVEQVKAEVKPGEKVIVLLDSCHTKEHVLAELNAYSPLVTQGSYIVAMDGIMEQVVGAPRTQPDWSWNNPKRAALEFVEKNPDFVIEEPRFAFNESALTERVTYWPNGFIRRIN